MNFNVMEKDLGIHKVGTKIVACGGDLDHIRPLRRDLHGSHGHTGTIMQQNCKSTDRLLAIYYKKTNDGIGQGVPMAQTEVLAEHPAQIEAESLKQLGL